MKRAAIATIGVIASFLIMYVVCTHAGADSSPAILAAALALGLARRPERLEPRVMLARFVALPLVGLAAGTIGLALRALPVVGAVLFCGGVALSVWLRNFGERGAALGRTIALPFMAMMIVPVHVNPGSTPGAGAVLVIAAGAIAFFCTTVLQWLL